MIDPASSVRDLYEAKAYPAMSHPSTDPALTAVSARLAGVFPPPPSGARILEIGCASGHNLVPLALRWPGSGFVGIDLSTTAIAEAQLLAEASGALNLQFQAVDLIEYEPEEPFDYIIAHGFFSWVPDEVKMALLDFCRRNLSADGVATISLNLESGWAMRMPIIERAREIQKTEGVDETTSLQILRSAIDPGLAGLLWILDSMIAKGPQVLPFDDFGPVNDPWPLDKFIARAGEAGLSWLGDSDPSEALPSGMAAEDRREIGSLGLDPLAMRLEADRLCGTMFRSCLFCRNDAEISEKIPGTMLFDFAIRAGEGIPEIPDPRAVEFHQAVLDLSPLAIRAWEILGGMDAPASPAMARVIFDGITRGWLRPRIEETRFDRSPPARPFLDPFRLWCARRGMPVVDPWQKSWRFPPQHCRVLAEMDGKKSRADLAAFSKIHAPDLAFDPWLDHLAANGLFSGFTSR